jgi:hypothetical protein
MKVFLMSLLLASACLANGADQKASYVVPTAQHLVEFSRFDVEIVKSYTGVSSDEISYLFPKELTGDPALQVNFKRTSSDLETGVSLWDAKEMTATCTDDGKTVLCNMYLKKTLRGMKTILDPSGAKSFIMGSGLPQNIISAKLEVLDQFLDSEPAGILSYEYN